jgi:hypothetical protein
VIEEVGGEARYRDDALPVRRGGDGQVVTTDLGLVAELP